MLLAEALIEKDYIVESIDNLSSTINSLLLVYNESDREANRKKLKHLFKEFEDLYTKYQQFSIRISRAEALASVDINKTEISLKDAMVIKNVMESKLIWLADFKRELVCDDLEKVVCADVDALEETIDMLRADIKTLKIKIQNKVWNTEVK